MKKIFIITTIAFVFSACETVLTDVPVPEIPVKGVVFGNLNTLSNWSEIEVTKTRPILNEAPGNQHETILNADVKVYINQEKYDFDFFEDQYVHNGFVDVDGGEEVRLEVNTDEFGMLSTRFVIPENIPSYEISVDSITREWDTEYKVVIDLDEDGSEERYYRVEGFSDYGDDVVEAWGTREYFTNDKMVDGKVRLATSLYTWESSKGENPKLFIILSSITKEHYKYGTVLETYEPDNPFAEPNPLPSNIDGGLGLFTISMSNRLALN